MATTQTFYRKADTTRAEATASLYSRFPNADLISFVKKAATVEEAAAAGAKPGEQVYEATVRLADFPPADDAGDDSGSDSKPEKKEKPETSDDGGDDGGSDDGGGAPDFGGGDDGKGAEPLSGEDLTNDLLQKILDAISGGAGPVGAGGPGGPGDLDLPDIGAPGQGEGLGAPAGPKAPLPPPVKDKSPIGAGAFAHYDPKKAEFSTVRVEANQVGNKAIIAEAAEVYPTHRVARIQRTGSATLNGRRYNLAENGIAVVTLTAK